MHRGPRTWEARGRVRGRFTCGNYAHTSSDIEVLGQQIRTGGSSLLASMLGRDSQGYELTRPPTRQKKQTYLVGCQDGNGYCDSLSRLGLEIRRFREGPGGSMKPDPCVRCCNRWRRSFGQREHRRRRAGSRDEQAAAGAILFPAHFFQAATEVIGCGGVVQHSEHTTEDNEERDRATGVASRAVAADHVGVVEAITSLGG